MKQVARKYGLSRLTAPLFLTTDESERKSEVGNLISRDDGSFELSMSVIPMPNAAIEFDMPKEANLDGEVRPIAALIEGPVQSVRIEIGQVTVANGTGRAILFAQADFSAAFVF